MPKHVDVAATPETPNDTRFARARLLAAPPSPGEAPRTTCRRMSTTFRDIFLMVVRTVDSEQIGVHLIAALEEIGVRHFELHPSHAPELVRALRARLVLELDTDEIERVEREILAIAQSNATRVLW